MQHILPAEGYHDPRDGRLQYAEADAPGQIRRAGFHIRLCIEDNIIYIYV